MQIWFRLSRIGREHVPKKGGVILAANHRSFLDPFIVGVCVGRPVYFVAKRELFEKRWQGWLLNALGAFPIRRGESDAESMGTGVAALLARAGLDVQLGCRSSDQADRMRSERRNGAYLPADELPDG